MWHPVWIYLVLSWSIWEAQTGCSRTYFWIFEYKTKWCFERTGNRFPVTSVTQYFELIGNAFLTENLVTQVRAAIQRSISEWRSAVLPEILMTLEHFGCNGFHKMSHRAASSLHPKQSPETNEAGLPRSQSLLHWITDGAHGNQTRYYRERAWLI